MAFGLCRMENTQIWSAGFAFTLTQDEERVLCYLWVSIVYKSTRDLPAMSTSVSVIAHIHKSNLVSVFVPLPLPLLQVLLYPCRNVQLGSPSPGPFTLILQNMLAGPTFFLHLLLSSPYSTPGMQRRALSGLIWSPLSAHVAKAHYGRWAKCWLFLVAL